MASQERSQLTIRENPFRKEEYHIGIICALAHEAAAMGAMLDAKHPALETDAADPNNYTFGSIGEHNLVIACLPAGRMGNGPAAVVASNLTRSFSIKFGLMVGIGGGVWSKKNDIRLGDIVVSQPMAQHGGVAQWDYGKTVYGGPDRGKMFERTSSLNSPPAVLLHALQSLKIFNETDYLGIPAVLDLMAARHPRMAERYGYYEDEEDRLYKADYNHEGGETCENCAGEYVVKRKRRKDREPEVHYGNIASGNHVMKHGVTRDDIAREENVICFEMEAAGLMNDFPCLVIRGICDYADSHKNKEWQRYAAATAAGFAKVLLQFIDKQEVVRTAERPNTHRLLPFGRNNKFVGRKHVLEQLKRIFIHDKRDNCCQYAALDGLGGVGKTHIALEFAYSLEEDSPNHSVFWVNANDTTSFVNSYREIGQELCIPKIDESKADVRRLVYQHLSQSKEKWLLIVDNADDDKLFQRRRGSSLVNFLPSSNLGGVLFTTRNHAIATDHAETEVISIDMMDNSEARELFENSLQRKELMHDTGAVSLLLELLANFPLAIKQASAYLNHNHGTIAKYIETYTNSNQMQIELLSRDFEDKWRYQGMANPVATTWLVSFQQLKKQNILAAEYLSFMSCINEKNIPISLLPPAPASKQQEAIGALKGFGFLTKQNSDDLYDMHRLVHITMYNWLRMNDRLREITCIVALQIVSVLPWPGYDNRGIWTLYFAHAEHLMESLEVWHIEDYLQWKILDKLGLCHFETRNYSRSEQCLKKSLELRERALGTEDPSTLNTASDYAQALSAQHKYSEALPLQRHVSMLMQKVLGEEHRSTLVCRTDLGTTLIDMGNYTEAEIVVRGVLSVKAKVLGKRDPSTLTAMGNLVKALQCQKRYTEAEAINRELLQLDEKVHGLNHPRTLNTVHSLSFVLGKQKRFKEAFVLFKRAISGLENACGKDHPDTLKCYEDYENLRRQHRSLQEKL